MDFIFNVDLSTVYIIVRRDFASAEDEQGVTSMPLGGGFYYSAEAASQAAQQYCMREAAKTVDYMSKSTCHGQKDGMYWGGCITKEAERHRFEVRVRRLKARGGPWRSSGEAESGSVMASRGSLATAVEDGSYGGKVGNGRWPHDPSSLSSRWTGSRAGRLWDTLRRR